TFQTTVIRPLSLHDALPFFFPFLGREARAKAQDQGQVVRQLAAGIEARLSIGPRQRRQEFRTLEALAVPRDEVGADVRGAEGRRSEEHTSELQSRENLVCRL